MFRGTTARTALALLAAVLLALPFFAPTSPFAHAHTVRQVEAKTKTGIKPSGKPLRDEYVTVRDCGHPGGPADPLRSRDRHRVTATAASAPQEPERALLALDPAAAHQPVRPAAPHHRTSRSSAAHSPAALQVFRC
ncbi:hypothetical protein [Streptomyces sp. NBC_00582]|uniref:hypothetical protein n=1 Tax=Streptomyces sp. NBC_00582 TaxID=2975783 RepID=UPI001063EEB8|nr:hypothetical protein [Streptomyces sp. NBC_00582]WUB61249.1 hypothetical protein OG852_13080 [Streptomyces sp. NBC_00582]